MIETTLPQTVSTGSVGTRVSWGAICAGSLVALALILLLSTLGAAVGLSINYKASSTAMQTGSVAWGLFTLATALFVGGLIATLLTVGETKTEGVIHGILMWSLVVGVLYVAGAAGLNAFIDRQDRVGSTLDRSPVLTGAVTDRKVTDLATPENHELMKKFAWLSFAGTWLSMLAAALGAYLGAGPVFRVVRVQHTLHGVQLAR